MSKEDIKIKNPIDRRFVVSAILIEEISEFITHISRKYNGSPDMLRATKLMFDALMDVSIEIEQSRIDRLDKNSKEDVQRDCLESEDINKFVKELKELGVNVHVVKVDK